MKRWLVFAVLAVSVASSGCCKKLTKKGSGGEESSGKVTEPRETKVRAVWVSGKPGPQVTGGTSELVVRVQPNTTGKPSIGVLESFSGGVGNQWKTAGWIAAFNASQQAGADLSDNEFIVKVGGHIDGPSAGMLMTSTMLALLRNESIRPNTTMTGTINPDGSAGPVGGIVQKMDGARKDGIERFGYPIGTRTTKDLRNGQEVDLEAYGKRLGFKEVREIDDVQEAYEFMTGKKIERAQPVADSEMDLPSNMRMRMKAKILSWKGRLQAESSELKSALRTLPRGGGAAVVPWLKEYQKDYEQAQTFEKSGLLPAAYRSYVRATLNISLAKETSRFVEHMAKGRWSEIDGQITRLSSVKKELQALEMELTARSNRKTLGGQVSAVSGFQTYVLARSFSDEGDHSLRTAAAILSLIRQKKLRRTSKVKEALVRNLLEPVLYFSGAKALYRVAKDELELIDEQGKASSVDLQSLGKYAGAYGAAAGASLNYFDALITDQIAQSHNLSKAAMTRAMGEIEPDYPITRQAARLAEWEGRGGTPPAEMSLLRLAAGSTAYISSASLINKWYSLGAQKKGDKLVIARRRALTSQLDLAKKSARISAAEAKKAVGFIPVGAKLNYQLGNALREGSDEEKLEALRDYWLSKFYSDLVVSLSKMH